MSFFDLQSDFPPSLTGQPIYYMIVVVGMLIGTLLCMKWLFIEIDDLVNDGYPRRHPVTANRWIKILFIIAGLIVSVPRLIMVMGWGHMGPAARNNWALGSWLVYALWGILLAAAWFVDHVSRSAINQHLALRPVVLFVDEADARSKKYEGIRTLGLIVLIAFATTYIRPAQHHDRTSIIEPR